MTKKKVCKVCGCPKLKPRNRVCHSCYNNKMKIRAKRLRDEGVIYVRELKIKNCMDCGVEIYSRSSYCNKCSNRRVDLGKNGYQYYNKIDDKLKLVIMEFVDRLRRIKWVDNIEIMLIVHYWLAVHKLPPHYWDKRQNADQIKEMFLDLLIWCEKQRIKVKRGKIDRELEWKRFMGP